MLNYLQEAVEVTVTPRRSLKTINEEVLENMYLSVELKNISDEKEDEIAIEVLEASLLSRQWRLGGLTTMAVRLDELAAHERVHLIFNAQRILELLDEEKVEHTCLKVSKSFTDAMLTPYYNFISDFKPCFIDLPDCNNHEAQSSKQGLIQSMFVIRWKANNKIKGKSVIGQHSLWLDCFTKATSRKKDLLSSDLPMLQLDDSDSKTESKDQKPKNRKDNVVFRLEHKNTIHHDFKQRKLCLVPITINVVNCYGVPVKVFIDMSKHQNR